MPKTTLLFLALALVAILAGFPTTVFAAEEVNAVNLPGWVGGTLAALAVILAVAGGLWARRRL